MAETSPSILNFVRQKAAEGEEWAKLHLHLKSLNALDVEGEKKKVEDAKAEQAKLAEQLKRDKDVLTAARNDQKMAQEAATKVHLDAETELAQAKQRAEEIILEAHRNARTAASVADEAVVNSLAERNQVQADIDNLTVKHKELLAVHTNLQNAHDDLIRKHTALKNALDKMAPNL